MKYEVGKSKAPKIVATGKGVVAQKILKVAEENKVPFFEDKSLTDLLAKLDLDVEVPPELFTLVAEVLAVVYQMDKMAKKRSKMSKEKRSLRKETVNDNYKSFIVIFVVSKLLYGDYGLGYQEFADPTVDLATQGMRMHQIQWNNYGLYTANLHTPGYVEIGGYGYRKGDKLLTVPFYRWRHGPVMDTNRMLDFYIDADGRGFQVNITIR